MNDSRLFEAYPTWKDTGLKTHREASYNAIQLWGWVKRSSNFST